MRSWIVGVSVLVLTGSAASVGCGGDEDSSSEGGNTATTGGTGGTTTGGSGGTTTGGSGGTTTGGTTSGGTAGSDPTGSGGAAGGNSDQCPADAQGLDGDNCDSDGLQCDYTAGPGSLECTCTDGSWACDFTPGGQGGAGGAAAGTCPTDEPGDGDGCNGQEGLSCDYGAVTCDCENPPGPGGDEWSCTGAGQGGAGQGGASAGQCPGGEPGDGDACDGQVGLSCDYGAVTCDCENPPGPGGDEWSCTGGGAGGAGSGAGGAAGGAAVAACPGTADPTGDTCTQQGDLCSYQDQTCACFGPPGDLTWNCF